MTNKGRKKRKFAIWTDTPEKELIRREQEEIERKKRAKGVRKKIGRILSLNFWITLLPEILTIS